MALYINKKNIMQDFDDRVTFINEELTFQQQTGQKQQEIKNGQEYENVSFFDIDVHPDRNEVVYDSLYFRKCIFDKSAFQYVTFVNCRFDICSFSSCKFVSARFIDCNFEPRIYYPIKVEQIEQGHNGMLNSSCLFQETLFSRVTFDKCNIRHSAFKDTRFVDVNISKSDLKGAIFITCSFINCNIYKSKLMNASLLETAELSIQFDSIEKSDIGSSTSFHCSKNVGKKNASNWENYTYRCMYAQRYFTYIRISKIYMRLGYTDISGEYNYIAKKEEQKSLLGRQKIFSMLVDALCGYGERPSHTFICVILNILLFGLMYLFSGFAIGDKLVNLSVVQKAIPNIPEVLKLYCHSVFFSITTFSTVGYGNYVPVGAISSALAAIQMLMGVALTALWTGCIFRKISR